MKIAGIDLGLSGGIAIIKSDRVHSIIDIPVLSTVINNKERNVYDVIEIIKIFNELQTCNFVFVENVQPINSPNSSKGANFSQGYAKGLFEAMLISLNIKHEFVRVQDWQKHFGIVKPNDKVLAKKWTTKGPVYITAIRLFPDATQHLSTVRGRVLDGRSDALLIAEYGRRKVSGVLTNNQGE